MAPRFFYMVTISAHGTYVIAEDCIGTLCIHSLGESVLGGNVYVNALCYGFMFGDFIGMSRLWRKILLVIKYLKFMSGAATYERSVWVCNIWASAWLQLFFFFFAGKSRQLCGLASLFCGLHTSNANVCLLPRDEFSSVGSRHKRRRGLLACDYESRSVMNQSWQ